MIVRRIVTLINIRLDNANIILSWLMMKNVDVEYIYMDTNINTFEVIIEINISNKYECVNS